MDDPEITLVEAADTIRGLCRQRIRESRSFDKLEAALSLAVATETAIARLTNSRESLDAEVAARTKAAAEQAATLTAEIATLDAERGRLEAEAGATRQRLEKEIEQLMQAADAHRAEISDLADAGQRAYVTLRERLSREAVEAELAHRQRLDVIAKETWAAEAQLRQAKAAFKEFAGTMAKEASV